jgi:competence protein ComEA
VENLNLNLETLFKFKVPLTLAFLGIVFVALGIMSPSLNQKASDNKEIVVSNPSSSQSGSKIKVDVSGAVKAPGVYSLDKDSRVFDAVTAAGGLTSEADQSWVAKTINLAAKLLDGQKIYIKTIDQKSNLTKEDADSKININTASESELDSLPGVGKVTAEKIIAARPFSDPKELLTKKIVGNSTYEKIKDLVSVY